MPFLSHPFFLAREFAWSAYFHQLCREARSAQARAEAALALIDEHGFAPMWRAQGTLARGWAIAQQGQAEAGVEQIRHSLNVFQTFGLHLCRPYNFGMLAEAYKRDRRSQAGLSALEEALASARRTGEHWYDAELYRLQGELTLEPLESGALSPEAEAEACFTRAIDIARRQGARLFELRAVMSLARLWRRQGKKQEARVQLAEVYGWFTEGFDTKDLREARALLGS